MHSGVLDLDDIERVGMNATGYGRSAPESGAPSAITCCGDEPQQKSCDQSAYRLSTPSDVVDRGAEFQVAMPAASSRGAYGYNQTWLNSDNEWIWPHLHRATGEMARIAREHPGAEGLTLRALNQLARELVLVTASDWPFMISMGTTVDYAESRLRTHINRFNRLLEQIQEARINEDWLSRIEACDNIFRYIDYTTSTRRERLWTGDPPAEATQPTAPRVC